MCSRRTRAETEGAMKRATSMKKKDRGAEAQRFQNRMYRAEIRRTPAGSPILQVHAANSTGRFANHRQIAAFIYELAAEMERRSESLRADWVVSPERTNERIVLEPANDEETVLADDFLATLIRDHDLA